MCKCAWQEYFDVRSRTCGIWYKTIQPQISLRPWVDSIQMSTLYIKLAMRLRSGHILGNKFGYLMKKVESPNCRDCGVVEDIQHVVLECARNERLRLNYFKVFEYNAGQINTILAYPSSDEATMMFKLTDICLRNNVDD
ncbi:hypothetical protein RR48_13469 [Papilio machaon]|uniref:Reverse transcriptase zinc-binding domain-containing protein n=1 Tax=Papilio machaon TaxID=76193 RepID=A0A194R981_PAPMA|nr:hypothetical protein RR48_13469 [Papilio machaon]